MRICAELSEKLFHVCVVVFAALYVFVHAALCHYAVFFLLAQIAEYSIEVFHARAARAGGECAGFEDRGVRIAPFACPLFIQFAFFVCGLTSLTELTQYFTHVSVRAALHSEEGLSVFDRFNVILCPFARYALDISYRQTVAALMHTDGVLRRKEDNALGQTVHIAALVDSF